MMKNAIYGVVVLYYIYYYVDIPHLVERQMKKYWRKFLRENTISNQKNGTQLVKKQSN